jgi:hypothetical protein
MPGFISFTCFVTTDTTHIQGKRGRIEEILPISYPVLQAG